MIVEIMGGPADGDELDAPYLTPQWLAASKTGAPFQLVTPDGTFSLHWTGERNRHTGYWQCRPVAP